MMNVGRPRLVRIVFASLVAATGVEAATFDVLTTGKVIRLENRGDADRNAATLVVGADPKLATVYDPRCPSASSVEIEAYLQSTYRDAILALVDLDCAKWTATRSGYRYADKAGTVRRIRYGKRGLRIDAGGPGFTPHTGPVGFAQVDFAIGEVTLRTRTHNFARNDARSIRSRKPSSAAAAGEAAFWDVLSGDDASEARQQDAILHLGKAKKRDGRSHFLLGMIHLYRFGQQVTGYDEVTPTVREELVQANGAFATAVPRLWDDTTLTGDSRVPGFAAAAKYTQGVVDGDAALRAAGLADLQRAVEVNAFFNVFDFIPVLQALPPSDPSFIETFVFVTTYLNDPDTLTCLISQPEICANAGLAPRNLQGSLILFGDLYAKAGDAAQAQTWYGLASASGDLATWRFKSVLDDRLADPAGRAALYADADPTNDPPLVGAAHEACAVCHNR
jgi:hypothetical protein